MSNRTFGCVAWSFALALVGVGGATATARAQVIYAAVAVQGQEAPGTGVPFSSLLNGFGIGSPVIDNLGNVAFRAFLQSGNTSNDSGTFCGPAGGVMLWAREGSAIPGGGVFGQNSDNQRGFPIVNAGVVAAVYPRVPLSAGDVLVVGAPGAAVGLIRTGLQIPGLPTGANCNGFLAEPSVSPTGKVAVVAFVTGGGFNNQRALLSNHTGPFGLVAVTNRPAPGSPGETLSFIGPVGFGGSNHIIFKGGLPGFALFSDRSGALGPIYRDGAVAAPGFPGQTITQIHVEGGPPHFNAAGQVAFRAFTSGNTAAIFSEGFGPLGTLHLVARSFQPLPQFGFAQLNDLTFASPIAFNDLGEVAFFHSAFYSGFNLGSIFVERSAGSLQLVARQGDPAPIPGLTFAAIDGGSVRLNNSGQVAFAATLAGPGVTASNDRGLFAKASAGGPLLKLFREGDTLDVFGDGSSIRTIASFEFSLQESNQFVPAAGLRNGHGAFNDQGAAVALLGFVGGTEGIFTATIPCLAISDHPDPVDLCGGGTAVLSVSATGSGTLSYQWRKDHQALSNGAAEGGSMISGADTATVTIAGVSAADAGSYDCVVTASCGTATSNAAAVSVCAADFNCDGGRDPDDLADFVTCFFLDVQFPGTCPAADFNRDGFRDPDDLSDFVTGFFLGCA